MNLLEKIEEIRKKPEHIRMRYVWAWVGISMILVLLVWYFSFKSGTETTTEDVFTPDQMKTVDDLKAQKKSIEDATKNIQEGLKQVPQEMNNTGQNNQ